MEDNQINHDLNENDSIDNITLRFSNLLKLLDSDPNNVEDNSTFSKLKDLYEDITGIQQSVEKYKLFKEGQDLYTKWLLLARESGLWGEGSGEGTRENNAHNPLKELAALSYNNRGYLKYLQVDFEGAIQDYTKALKHNPALSCAYYNRGIVAYRLAFFDQAIHDMKTAVSLEPNSQTFQEGLEKVSDMAGSPTGHNFRLDYGEDGRGQGS